MGKVSHLHVCVTGCHDREFLYPSVLSFLFSLCSGPMMFLCRSLWWHSHRPNKLTLTLSSLGPRWLTVLLLPSADGIGLVPRKTSLVLCVLRVPTIFFLTVDRFNSRRKSNFLVHTEKLREHWMFYIPGVTKYCYLSLGGDAGEPD